MIRFVLLLVTTAACLFLTCTGTGSEVDGRHFAIEGRAFHSGNEPVAGAQVRIRPKGFLALYADEFLAFDTITDADGFFHFDTVPADSYTIEINKNGEIGVLQELTIVASDSLPIYLPAVTLTATGTIYGRINLPITDDTVRPYVALYNVDYLVKSPLTQDFRFAGLPEGIYSLMIVPTPQSRLFVQLDAIQVTGDSVVDVGTLNLKMQYFYKGCASFDCDSIAVRSILDSNGLSNIGVEDVATVDPVGGRIVGLNLSGRSLRNVPRNIGSLSMLSELNLTDNLLTSLPEHIGYLRRLRQCRLDNNQILELPYEISYIDSLRELTVRNNRLHRFDQFLINLPLVKLDLGYNELSAIPAGTVMFDSIQSLYLDHNQLTGLPDAITVLRPDTFSIAGNRLCNVSKNLSNWLMQVDADWEEQQICP